jgi:hypothetical protein
VTRRDTPFDHERIDEEIAALEQLAQAEGAPSPDTRLIADLRRAYRKTAADGRSLDTVFMRLQAHERSMRAQAPQVSSASLHPMKEGRRPLDTLRPYAALDRRPPRRAALAASLVLTLLVISGLVFAEVALRRAAVTPIYQPASSLRFTPIGLTKSVGDVTIHLKSAYADANNIYLLSSVEYKGKVPPEDVAPLSSAWGIALTMPNGVTIPFLNGIRSVYPLGEATPTVTPATAQVVDDLDHFNGAAVKGNPSSLRLTLRLTPLRGSPSVTVSPQGTQAPPVEFTFTVPFDAGQVVAVGQTATSHGWDVTLDQVVITTSETRAYFHSAPATFVYAAELHVAGHTYKSPNGVLVVGSKGSGKYAVTFNSAVDAYSLFVIGPLPGSDAQSVSAAASGGASPTPRPTYQSLEGQTGDWTVKVTQLYTDSSGALDGDWEFDFTVS